jgi:chemotaxis family two-component system response regulator Rcp1
MTRPREILLVDDDPAAARLTREALREVSWLHTLHRVPDGVEALAFLHRAGPYGRAPRPDVVLLDLPMPRKGGQEVLTAMKADPTLRRIPVVVLTTLADERDVRAADDRQAHAYVVKGGDFNRFCAALEALASFWLSAATLPPG